MTQSDWREKPLYDLVVHAWPHAAKDFPPFAKDDWNRVAEQVPPSYWQPWIRDRWSSGGKFCPKPNELLNCYRESREGGAFKEQRESEHDKWRRWEVEAETSKQHTAAWAEEQDDATLDALRDSWIAGGDGRRDFFTAKRQDRRDAFDFSRAPAVNIEDRLLSGSEIRAEPMLLGILRSWANQCSSGKSAAQYWKEQGYGNA